MQLCQRCRYVCAVDGKHVVFGEVVEGMEVIDKIEHGAVRAGDDKPVNDVTIVDCGQLSDITA
jgi:cyclophilin family peptidyl-prolyl cis-trans isomerase